MNSTKSILESMGFDVVAWTMPLEGGPTPMLQCTDKTGLTWYVRADCAATDALNRYRDKLEQFQTTKG